MKKIMLVISTTLGLLLGIYLGGNASGGIMWLMFGDSGDFQVGFLVIICISAISFGLGAFIMTKSIINTTVYSGSNLKSIIINNIYAIAIHLVICIITWNIFSENIIISLAILVLYPAMGYYSINHGSVITNYFSLFGGTFLGLLLWVIQKPWELINQFGMDGLNLVPFFYLNPFTFLGKLGMPKWMFIIISFCPSILTWVGLQLKHNKTKQMSSVGVNR